MLMRVLGVILSSAVLVSCASTPSVTVIQRADYLKEKPEWASLSNLVAEDKQNTYFLGYVELDSDVSKSAALSMADNKAYAMPMESMVEAYFQQNKIAEDLRKNSAVSELLMSSARSSRPAMPGLRVSKRYWEVVQVKTEKGNSEQLHVYSLAEIPNQEFEKAKKDVLANLNGNSELKKNLDEISKKQQESLLNQQKQ
jgi:hypothetical protein